MTCKDCVHYEACLDWYRGFKARPAKCEHFKDKSKFIELPCKVGDTVFIIGRNHHEAFINTGKFKISDMEKINKKVFLSYEKAEQALKESESK